MGVPLTLDGWKKRESLQHRSGRPTLVESATICRIDVDLPSAILSDKDLSVINVELGDQHSAPNCWEAVVDEVTVQICGESLLRAQFPATVVATLAKEDCVESDQLQKKMISFIARCLNVTESVTISSFIRAKHGFLTLLMGYCALNLMQEASIEVLQHHPNPILLLLTDLTEIFLTGLSTYKCKKLLKEAKDPLDQLLKFYIGLVVTAVELTNLCKDGWHKNSTAVNSIRVHAKKSARVLSEVGRRHVKES